MYGLLNAEDEEKIIRNDKIVKKVLDIIESEYMNGLSLKIIAKRIFLSPNYLGRIFNDVTGKTFNAYLMEFRMKKAEELLKNSRYPLRAIAVRVGIGDMSYFCAVFKSFYSTSPGKYREAFILRDDSR